MGDTTGDTISQCFVIYGLVGVTSAITVGRVGG